MSDVTASVVIPFKDWGLGRLLMCIGSTLESFQGMPAEVIVSDYGSEDGPAIEEAVVGRGGVYVRSDTDGVWSRSRALNAGFSHARGAILMATDADMIFAPGTTRRVCERALEHPHEAIILQYRDLPFGYSFEDLDGREIDWAELERVATVRPRWGMGGLVATGRTVFERLRGYDERMHTYGGEDLDYGGRVRRFGTPINWLDEPGVQMYHVWHPSSSAAAKRDPEARAAIAANRAIHTDDPTWVRNVRDARYVPANLPPVISVIARLRGVLTDEDANELASVLSQSVESLELVLVTDDPKAGDPAVMRLGDDRVRIALSQDDKPWWRVGIEAARGTFVTLHATGTYHVEARLESLLASFQPGGVAVADKLVSLFRSVDTSLHVNGDPNIQEQFTPWASLLVRRLHAARVVRSMPSTAAESQYAWALVRNGVAVVSTGAVGRVLVVQEGAQGESLQDRRLTELAQFRGRLSREKRDTAWLASLAGNALSTEAHLVGRFISQAQVSLVVSSTEPEVLREAARLPHSREGWDATSFVVSTTEGDELFGYVRLVGTGTALDADLRRLRRNADGIVTVTTILGDAPPDLEDPRALLQPLLREYDGIYGDGIQRGTWIAVLLHDATTHARVLARVGQVHGLRTTLVRDVSSALLSTRLVLALPDLHRSPLEVLLAVREAASPEDQVIMMVTTESNLSGLAQLETKAGSR